MSQPPQEFSYKKVKKSKSQGWSWPHLAAVPKKPASTSLHTPDEQAEVSATATEENTIHQSSPPRSPHPLAASPSDSATPPGEADVPEDQNLPHAEGDTEQNAQEDAQLERKTTQPDKGASLEQAEEGDLPYDAEEEDDQHVEYTNTIAQDPEKADEKASSHSEESLERPKHEPCSENNHNHGEGSSKPNFEATADAERQTTHQESAEDALENPGSSMFHNQTG